jgi:hypothetical protein
MRQLSLRQAWNCETAREKRCRCRCGGLLHGARRAKQSKELHGFAMNDPHFVPQPKKHRFPMRPVISFSFYRQRYSPSYGRTVELRLSCGHIVCRKSSKPIPRRVHCDRCK